MQQIHKYPRTQHIEGSRLQPGDEDLGSVRFEEIAGAYLVIEEKLDGANAAVSFSGNGRLRLQSRGHYLVGGARERHFGMLKSWATVHRDALWKVLGSRYVMYGEWLYAKHTVFYDQLPHFFMEFDVLDTRNGSFLSTPVRRQLLRGLPLCSVPVLARGVQDSSNGLASFVGPSLYKSEGWRGALEEQASGHGVAPETVVAETDPSDYAEGLYIKVERDGLVLERYKYVRASFLTSVVDSGSHWLSRPIVPNKLAAGVDIYAPELRPRKER